MEQIMKIILDSIREKFVDIEIGETKIGDIAWENTVSDITRYSIVVQPNGKNIVTRLR